MWVEVVLSVSLCRLMSVLLSVLLFMRRLRWLYSVDPELFSPWLEQPDEAKPASLPLSNRIEYLAV